MDYWGPTGPWGLLKTTSPWWKSKRVRWSSDTRISTLMITSPIQEPSAITAWKAWVKGRNPLTTPVKSLASRWQKLSRKSKQWELQLIHSPAANRLKTRSITLLEKTINTRPSLLTMRLVSWLTVILLNCNHSTIKSGLSTKGINWLRRALFWPRKSCLWPLWRAMILSRN